MKSNIYDEFREVVNKINFPSDISEQELDSSHHGFIVYDCDLCKEKYHHPNTLIADKLVPDYCHNCLENPIKIGRVLMALTNKLQDGNVQEFWVNGFNMFCWHSPDEEMPFDWKLKNPEGGEATHLDQSEKTIKKLLNILKG